MSYRAIFCLSSDLRDRHNCVKICLWIEVKVSWSTCPMDTCHYGNRAKGYDINKLNQTINVPPKTHQLNHERLLLSCRFYESCKPKISQVNIWWGHDEQTFARSLSSWHQRTETPSVTNKMTAWSCSATILLETRSKQKSKILVSIGYFFCTFISSSLNSSFYKLQLQNPLNSRKILKPKI